MQHIIHKELCRLRYNRYVFVHVVSATVVQKPCSTSHTRHSSRLLRSLHSAAGSAAPALYRYVPDGSVGSNMARKIVPPPSMKYCQHYTLWLTMMGTKNFYVPTRNGVINGTHGSTYVAIIRKIQGNSRTKLVAGTKPKSHLIRMESNGQISIVRGLPGETVTTVGPTEGFVQRRCISSFRMKDRCI